MWSQLHRRTVLNFGMGWIKSVDLVLIFIIKSSARRTIDHHFAIRVMEFREFMKVFEFWLLFRCFCCFYRYYSAALAFTLLNELTHETPEN